MTRGLCSKGGWTSLPRRTDIESICILGSGPIVIGQAAEFDYSGCQALKVLRADGFRTIVINSNPATIMTDPGFADRTYLEPLEAQHVGDGLHVERLEIRAVGEAGVGHDRRRIRVDDHRPVTLLAEHLERLAARVVELGRLADHDRAGADDADALEVGAPRH